MRKVLSFVASLAVVSAALAMAVTPLASLQGNHRLMRLATGVFFGSMLLEMATLVIYVAVDNKT